MEKELLKKAIFFSLAVLALIIAAVAFFAPKCLIPLLGGIFVIYLTYLFSVKCLGIEFDPLFPTPEEEEKILRKYSKHYLDR